MNFAFKNTIRHYKHLKKYTLNDNLKKGKHMKYIKSRLYSETSKMFLFFNNLVFLFPVKIKT